MTENPAGTTRPGAAREIAVIGLAALLLSAALFWPDYTLLDGDDWGRMHVFYKQYYRESLLAGRLPLWNPHVGLGRPFLADIETATLYPLNLVYLAGIGAGLFATLALHLGLVIWGGLRLARRLGALSEGAWLGALAFACSAPLVGRLQSGQLQVFCTLCWLPLASDLACALVARPTARAVVQFALGLALMFLAGSPPMFWICGWAIALFGLFQRPALRSLGALAGGTALAASLVGIQALPFWELVLEGNRALDASAFALANPQEGKSWLSLLVSKPRNAFFYWEYNLYAGLPVALGAIGASLLWRHRAVQSLYLLGGSFALLALGAATPVLPWLVGNAPGWAALRMPARYAVIVAFVAAMLAALSASRLAAWLQARCLARARIWSIVLLALAGVNAADCLRALHERAAMYASPALELHEAQIEKALRKHRLLAPGLPTPRVVAHFGIMRENSGMSRGYSTVASYANPALARVWGYLHTAAGAQQDPMDPINMPVEVFARHERLRGMNLALWWDMEQRKLQFEHAPDPRAFVSPKAEVLTGDWHDANRRIVAGFDFHQTALLERAFASAAAGLTSPSIASPVHAKMQSFQPERLVARYDSVSPGILVLSEAWFPGWTAHISSHTAAVVPVNGWMRGVAVPAGEHEVTLRYRPRSLWQGSLISLVACGIAAVLWIRYPARCRLRS